MMKAETAYDVFNALSEDERKRFAHMSGLSFPKEEIEEEDSEIILTEKQADEYVLNFLFKR